MRGSHHIPRVWVRGGNGGPHNLFLRAWPCTNRTEASACRFRESAMARAFTAKEAAEFFARFAAREPDPRSELAYKNPYTLLVAVVLSAQATDKGVNKATRTLFAVADDPAKMVALGEATLK